MNRSSSRGAAQPAAALAIAVIAILALVATVALGRGSASPDASPSESPTGSPSVPSTPPSPTPTPSVDPSEDPADGKVEVDLDNLTDHDVSVVIVDDTGALVEARSGKPGDGMSVRWFDSKIENVDANTLRLVWVGLPVDDEVALSISGSAGAYSIRLVQADPPANSDAVGFDRILVLEFDSPVSAEDVEVTIE